MTIDINSMPEYEQARARYDGAITQARAASDEQAATKAEVEWAQAQADLYRVAAERSIAQSSLETARAQARARFPLAPEAAYSAITDPAQVLAAAQATHEAITAAQGTPAPAPTAGQPGQPPSWPTPPVGGTPPPPPPEHPLDDPKTYRETFDRARNGNKSSERAAWENPDRQAVVDYALGRIERHGLQTVTVARPHDDSRKRRVEW